MVAKKNEEKSSTVTRSPSLSRAFADLARREAEKTAEDERHRAQGELHERRLRADPSEPLWLREARRRYELLGHVLDSWTKDDLGEAELAYTVLFPSARAKRRREELETFMLMLRVVIAMDSTPAEFRALIRDHIGPANAKALEGKDDLLITACAAFRKRSGQWTRAVTLARAARLRLSNDAQTAAETLKRHDRRWKTDNTVMRSIRRLAREAMERDVRGGQKPLSSPR